MKGKTSAINASIHLVNLTNYSKKFEKDDVFFTVLILENIVKETGSLNQVSLEKYCKNGVDVRGHKYACFWPDPDSF